MSVAFRRDGLGQEENSPWPSSKTESSFFVKILHGPLTHPTGFFVAIPTSSQPPLLQHGSELQPHGLLTDF